MDADIKHYFDGAIETLSLQIHELAKQQEARFERLESGQERIFERLTGIDEQLRSIDRRFERTEQRLAAIEARMNECDARIASLDAPVNRNRVGFMGNDIEVPAGFDTMGAEAVQVLFGTAP